MTKILKYWYFFYLCLIVMVGSTVKLLSNDKPLYCKTESKSYYPAIEEWVTGSSRDKQFNTDTWKQYQYQSCTWAPVPYAYYQQNFEATLESPCSEVSATQHHWLGTDHLGRDIAAGLINGCKVAVQIGLGSILLILSIGLFLGVLAGYFGNKGLRINALSLTTNGLLLMGICVYIYVLSPVLSLGQLSATHKWVFLLLPLGAAVLVIVIDKTSKKMTTLALTLPVDTIIMKMVELFTTIPKLLFLIAVLSIMDRSTFTIIVIIGCFGWTTVAKLVRAEILKVKEQEFILAVKLYDLPTLRIIWKHILPNVVAPVVTYACFGTAAAITAEAGLSYLGLGLPANEVSWGSMLSNSRDHLQAYWLVLLPGTCLFLTIYSLHKAGSYFRTKQQPTQLKAIETYF